VNACTLYQAASRTLRPGEPSRVRLLELAPGSRWQADLEPAMRAEWLVMSGEIGRAHV
jgi:hypothetical protein